MSENAADDVGCRNRQWEKTHLSEIAADIAAEAHKLKSIALTGLAATTLVN
jgi:phage protein D